MLAKFLATLETIGKILFQENTIFSTSRHRVDKFEAGDDLLTTLQWLVVNLRKFKPLTTYYLIELVYTN